MAVTFVLFDMSDVPNFRIGLYLSTVLNAKF